MTIVGVGGRAGQQLYSPPRRHRESRWPFHSIASNRGPNRFRESRLIPRERALTFLSPTCTYMDMDMMTMMRTHHHQPDLQHSCAVWDVATARATMKHQTLRFRCCRLLSPLPPLEDMQGSENRTGLRGDASGVKVYF